MRFHSYEVSNAVKFIETERMMVARGWEWGRMGRVSILHNEVFWSLVHNVNILNIAELCF